VDLVRARVALRERPLLDVLDLSIRFCVVNAAPYARLSAVALVPAFALSWAAARLGGWLGGWPVALGLAALVDALFVALAARLVFADETRVRDVVRASLTAMPRLAAVRLAQAFGFVLSLALLGMPWLWIGGVFLFLPEVVVVERATVGVAWRRAYRLAGAQLGIASAAMLLLSVFVVGAALVADAAGREILGSLLELRPPEPVFHGGVSALALLGFWSVLPLRATIRFFVYLDIRTRAEGWDIQTRFAALAAREARETESRRP
jgi:hypothetical protein